MEKRGELFWGDTQRRKRAFSLFFIPNYKHWTLSISLFLLTGWLILLTLRARSVTWCPPSRVVTRLQASVWPSALESVEASLLVGNSQWCKNRTENAIVYSWKGGGDWLLWFLSGSILRLPIWGDPADDNCFNDEPYWEVRDGLVEPFDTCAAETIV